MNGKEILKAHELINTKLPGFALNEAYNSIGSHIFFGFGKDVEITYPNKKKSMRKEWHIWISHSSWRITRDRKYIVGASDFRKYIKKGIQKLIGKRFQSLEFISPFLEAEFNFEDGYKLTTFFDWKDDNQWTIFLPDQNNVQFDVGADCSNDEKIEQTQNISKHFSITENYRKIVFPKQDILVTGITYDKYDEPTIHLENNFSIKFKVCTWRIEKDNKYIAGYTDYSMERLDNAYDKANNRLNDLIGKRLKQIDIANPMMDARFLFEDGSVIKTFTRCLGDTQWKILHKTKPIFCANIRL